MAIAPFVRQFAAVDPRWFNGTPFKSLQRWKDGIVSSELFEAVMTKFTVWRPGDSEATF